MLDDTKADVVVIEDRLDEAGRICLWLGLNALNNEIELVPAADAQSPENITTPGDASAIVLKPPRGDSQVDAMWQTLKAHIERHDPRIVIFDYLLSGESADEPFSGIEFGKRSKDQWPNLGVIVVTTGGDADLEGVVAKQQELDEQREDHDWPFDYVWVKAWGPAGKDEAGRILNTKIPYRNCVKDLLNDTSRPSEQ